VFIRRFKKDVQDQVRDAFPERTISRCWAEATPAEEHAYDRWLSGKTWRGRLLCTRDGALVQLIRG